MPHTKAMGDMNESKKTELRSPYVLYDYNGNKKTILFPFFQKIALPPGANEIPINPSLVLESCGSKILTGAVMGSVLGVGLGIFMGAMGDVSPIQIVHGKEVPQAPLREQMRSAMKMTSSKASGWAKNFGILTALFGGVECVIEKYRAKHDVWNPVLSGCVVGATLSASGGPQAACLGCVGFAGFSFVVDKIMGPH